MSVRVFTKDPKTEAKTCFKLNVYLNIGQVVAAGSRLAFQEVAAGQRQTNQEKQVTLKSERNKTWNPNSVSWFEVLDNP